MSLQTFATKPRQSTGNESVSQAWLRALSMTSRLDADPTRTLPFLIDELGEQFGDNPAILSQRGGLSYRALADRSNKYSRWALNQGLGCGDVVGLLMPNRPEYIAIWLGITRIGGIVALLNTNLTSTSLAHCITIAKPKHLIVAAELLNAFSSAAEHLDIMPVIWAYGDGTSAIASVDREIETCAGRALSAQERRAITLTDRALYIYTSGTTGLPKAANVSHQRLMSWSHWFAGMMDIGTSDRMYNCLPMYHSIGGVVAPAALLVAGASVVVSERFSAGQFWNEIVDWDCTLFQYIGELCRYLVNTKPNEAELKHRLRLVCGNGLRADIWTEFQNRFRIPRILEFYAATEHNFSLFNVEGKPGAIGRIPNFLGHRFPAALIRSDLETGEPIRDSQGLCARCAPNEVGEAIGRIFANDANSTSRFEGYTNAADSERKLIRDVFSKGDTWLRTGDLMRMDDKGYFYFVDRLGDTFRWKGENVATCEVAETISQCPGVSDVCVYGVAVTGTEGRAGMAALVVEPSFTLDNLHRHLEERLPDYAHPRFIRIVGDLATTETFKKKKHELVREAYEPTLIMDALYVRDAGARAFVAVDATTFEAIQAGQIRL